MVSRSTLATIPRAPKTHDALEDVAEAYWNAFRAGYVRVGGKARDYPKWKDSTDPIKDETRRCLRHAMEPIIAQVPEVAALFPDPPKPRAKPHTDTDARFVTSQKLARMGE